MTKGRPHVSETKQKKRNYVHGNAWKASAILHGQHAYLLATAPKLEAGVSQLTSLYAYHAGSWGGRLPKSPNIAGKLPQFLVGERSGVQY